MDEYLLFDENGHRSTLHVGRPGSISTKTTSRAGNITLFVSADDSEPYLETDNLTRLFMGSKSPRIYTKILSESHTWAPGASLEPQTWNMRAQ
jgi:hypothetical protein